MKKLLLVSCLAAMSFPVFALSINPADAFVPAVYAGIQGGYFDGHNFTDNEIGISPDNNYAVGIDGGGVRGYIGYDWSSVFATEVGYAHFSGSNDLSDSLGQVIANIFISPTGTTFSSKTDMNQDTVDALAKINIPVPFIHPYIKAGAAYVKTDLDTKVTLTNSFLNYNSTQTFDKSTSGIMPVIGAGVESSIIAGLNVDLGWMRYQHVSTNTEDTDFFMVGLSYHFG